MIDTYLPDIAPSRGDQPSPQSSASSKSHQDEPPQNFLELVKQKQEKPELDSESHEGEESLALKDTSDDGWMPHLLALTQMTQKAEAANPLASFMLATDIQEIEDTNSGLVTKAQSHFHPGKEDVLFATAKERMVDTTGRRIFEKEGESGKGKTHLQQAQANTRSAAMAQDMPAALKAATATGQQSPNLSGRYHPSHETPLQQHHPVSGRQDLPHLLVPQQKTIGIFESGDKIALENIPSSPTNAASSPGMVEGIDIIHARKQGDLTILQLQLNPENLGMIEAKLRLDKNQLMVEVSAAREETARLLAKDQHLLVQTLEKAGFGGEMRLTVGIIDRSSSVMPWAVDITADTQNLGSRHESAQDGREPAEQQSGSSSHSSQARDREDDTGREKNGHNNIIERPSKKSTGRHGYVSGSSHRLIV